MQSANQNAPTAKDLAEFNRLRSAIRRFDEKKFKALSIEEQHKQYAEALHNVECFVREMNLMQLRLKEDALAVDSLKATGTVIRARVAMFQLEAWTAVLFGAVVDEQPEQQ